MGVASEPDPKWLELPAGGAQPLLPWAPVWQRALIVLAGPVVNLLFAALILASFAFAYGVERDARAEVRAVLPEQRSGGGGRSGRAIGSSRSIARRSPISANLRRASR